MKKTKSNRRFLCLIVTIILLVTCSPLGVLAQSSNEAWLNDTDTGMNDELLGDAVELGMLIPIISFSDDVVYNGNPQILATINPEPDSLDLNPEMIEITYKGIKSNGEAYAQATLPPTDAGTYTVLAKYQGDDSYMSIEETREIKIKPLELKTTEFFTEKPITKIYDGNTKISDNAIQGLGNSGVVNTDINAVSFGYKSASFLSKDVKLNNPNMVVLKEVVISGSKGKNYIIVEEKKETKPLTSLDVFLVASINPKPVEVFLAGQDKVYDGTANLYDYELTINQADLIKGEEVGAFGAENFYPYYGDMGIQQDYVGTYNVWATGGFYLYGINGTNADNYSIKNNTIISTKKYEIAPAAVTVIPSYVSKIEGEPDPALTYVVWQDDSGDGFVKGLYGDDVLYGSLEREEGETPGTYDVYQGSLNNFNYNISLVDGKDKFEIIKSEDAIAAYTGNDYYNDMSGTGEAKVEKEKVAYFRIALLLVLLIAGGAFFGKNRLTKMD